MITGYALVRMKIKFPGRGFSCLSMRNARVSNYSTNGSNCKKFKTALVKRLTNSPSNARNVGHCQHRYTFISPPQYCAINLRFDDYNNLRHFFFGHMNYSVDSTMPTVPDTQLLATSISSNVNVKKRKYIVLVWNKIARKIRNWVALFWEALLVSIRGGEVAIRLSPLLLLTPASIMAEYFNTNSNRNINEYKATMICNMSWRYFINAIQSLGPAFVKLSQWASTRRDLFPRQFCNRLSELQDNGQVHSWEHAHKSLTDAFGDDYSKMLKFGDNIITLGTGSVAQVYRGSILCQDRTGKKCESVDVAVKILHPNIRHRVEKDLCLMKRVAHILDSLPFQMIHMLNLPTAIDNFSTIMRNQIDLTLEGNNLQHFHANFNHGKKDREGSNVTFPLPHEGWVTENVLVEDYIHDAVSINEYLQDNTQKGLEIRRKLAKPLLLAFLKMVFTDNFIHCDLHPGNVFVRRKIEKLSTSPNHSKDGNSSGEYEIFFLDAGITTSLHTRDRRNLIDLFRSVILNDGETAGRLMVERSFRTSDNDGGHESRISRTNIDEHNVEKFTKGISEIVNDFHDRRKKGLTLGVVHIGSLLGRVLDLCRIYRVEIDPNMANIVISTLVLEGLGRSLDSDLNLMSCALPFLLDLN